MLTDFWNCNSGTELLTGSLQSFSLNQLVDEYHKLGTLGGHMISPESSLVHRVFLPLLRTLKSLLL